MNREDWLNLMYEIQDSYFDTICLSNDIQELCDYPIEITVDDDGDNVIISEYSDYYIQFKYNITEDELVHIYFTRLWRRD